MHSPSPNWDKLCNEIGKLQQAHELLEELYLAVGPYQDGEIPDKTWSKVKDYFKFDDSE